MEGERQSSPILQLTIRNQGMSANNLAQIRVPGEATGHIPPEVNQGKPITVISTAAFRETFDARCSEQSR